MVVTLEGIATTTETVANAKSPGNPAVARQIISRIGFSIRKEIVSAGRTTSVKSTAPGRAYCQMKALALGTTYHRRWSADGGKTVTRVRDSQTADMTIGGLPTGPLEFEVATTPPLKRGEIVDAHTGEPAWGPKIPVTVL